jgi:hypothetical protein
MIFLCKFFFQLLRVVSMVSGATLRHAAYPDFERRQDSTQVRGIPIALIEGFLLSGAWIARQGWSCGPLRLERGQESFVFNETCHCKLLIVQGVLF